MDAGSSPLRLSLNVTEGSFSLGSTAGLVFSSGDGANDASMVFTGTVAQLNAALNNLVYQPVPGAAGSATLSLSVDDQGNTGSGGALGDVALVNIAVLRAELWLSTAGNATAAASAGGLSWLDTAVMRLGDPGLALGAGHHRREILAGV